MNTGSHEFPDFSDLPPLPPPGASGPQVCTTIRLYLAVMDDLPLQQARRVSEHIQSCVSCATEWRQLQNASQLVSTLPASAPSARVDAAIMAMLAARQKESASQALRSTQPAQSVRPIQPVEPSRSAQITPPAQPARPLVRLLDEPPKKRRPRRRLRLIGQLVAAAVFLLAVLAGTFFLSHSIGPGAPTAFNLPTNLSWNGYVLHFAQTKKDQQGTPFHIDGYQNLGTGRVHVETTMGNELDVIAVGDEKNMLGEDMMHHVAAWGADAWAVDTALFDLGHLRQALQTKNAVYLGTGTFQGQPVYRVRESNGQVLLLNMKYQPVNLLNSTGSTPVYDTFGLMPATQIDKAMWDMNIPSGFHMGQLPQKP